MLAFVWAALPASSAAQQIPADTARDAPMDTVSADQVRGEMERRRSASPSRRVAQPDRRGTTVLADWPRSLPNLLDRMGRRAPALLPKLDTLTIDYAYTTGRDIVDMRFGILWQPGETVLFEGNVIPRSEAPPDIRMTSFEILLDVVKGGQKVAETVIAVDSMALPPSPGYYEFDVSVPYEQVFLDAEASDAELFMREGVEFERPLIERIGFRPFRNGVPVGVVSETNGQMERNEEAERAPDRPRRAPAPTVYSPRTRILIGWRIGPDPYYVGPVGRPVPSRSDEDRRVVERPDRSSGEAGRTGRETTAGREATTGRGAVADRRGNNGGDDADGDGGRTGRGNESDAGNENASGERSGETASSGRTGRSGTSGSSDKGDEEKGSDKRDDDEDDDNLAPAALGAAAVVAGIAYVGGTVGVYGTAEAPIGLAAGVTKKRWGLQLQAAINPEVIEQEGTQRLNAKVMGFYDVIGGSPVQPALGAGVQFQAIGDETTAHSSFSIGAVVNTGRIVIFGGYDLPRNTPEFGFTYNFR
jgi:hypothetical protein